MGEEGQGCVFDYAAAGVGVEMVDAHGSCLWYLVEEARAGV